MKMKTELEFAAPSSTMVVSAARVNPGPEHEYTPGENVVPSRTETVGENVRVDTFA